MSVRFQPLAAPLPTPSATLPPPSPSASTPVGSATNRKCAQVLVTSTLPTLPAHYLLREKSR